MKSLILPFLTFFLAAITSHGVEITIKTPEDKKEEEKKEEKKEEKEEKKPDRPKDTVLSINAVNQTSYDFAIHTKATVKDQENQGILVQNISPSNTLRTFATFLVMADAEAGTTFVFDKKETTAVTTSPRKYEITCEIVKPEKDDEKEEKGDDAAADDKKDSDEGEEEPPIELKKSITFLFYEVEGETFPRCLVEFDADF